MAKKNKLPKGWLDYDKVGNQVPGTRFIAFKVPLKETICNKQLQFPSAWFTPDILLKTVPKLKLIVNLTNTESGRYYDYSFFEKNGIEILPLKCEGRGVLPSNQLINTFHNKVDSFLCNNADNEDALIGVHCTHGLNRTGLFICKYMVERMGIAADEAIQQFQTARGHKMERHQYIDAIQNTSSALSSASVKNEHSANYVRNYQNKRTCSQRQDNGCNKSQQNWRYDRYNNGDSRYSREKRLRASYDLRNPPSPRKDVHLNKTFSARNGPYVTPQRRNGYRYPQEGYSASPLDNCYD